MNVLPSANGERHQYKKIAFIGLGKMGLPIAQHLARGGHTVIGYDIAFSDDARNASDIILASDVSGLSEATCLVTMVPDDNAIIEIAKSVATSNKQVWLNLSTISLALTKDILADPERSYDFHMLPVMGRQDVAQAGALDAYFGGKKGDLDQIRPLLDCFTKKVWYISEDPLSALIVKLSGNFLLNVTIEALGEAFALTEKAGISPALFSEIILQDYFNCPAFRLYSELILSEAEKPAGFELHMGLKDIRNIDQAAEIIGSPLPFASIVKNHFIEAMSLGARARDESWLAMISRRHAALDPL